MGSVDWQSVDELENTVDHLSNTKHIKGKSFYREDQKPKHRNCRWLAGKFIPL